MMLMYTDEFFDVFNSYEADLKKKVFEKVKLLTENPSHPSLNVHKMKCTDGKWEMYVDMGRRIIYDIIDKTIRLWRLGSHDIVDRVHNYSFSIHTRFHQWHEDRPVERYSKQPQWDVQQWYSATSYDRHTDNPFVHFPVAHLRILGIPPHLISQVRNAGSLEDIMEIEGLPEHTLNWMLELATNEQLEDILYDSHRLLYRSTLDQLEGYCEGKIKRLMLNLNDDQQRYTEMTANNTLLIRGCAGSGKTTVGIYRAINQAIRDRKVLVLTYTRTLSAVSKTLIEELVGNTTGSIAVATINQWMLNLLSDNGRVLVQPPESSLTDRMNKAIEAVRESGETSLILERPIEFFVHEIGRIIKGCMLHSLADYLAHERLGGRTPLSAEARKVVWMVYTQYRDILEEHEESDWADIPLQFMEYASEFDEELYDEIIIDEAQDLSAAQILAVRKLLKQDGCLTILTDSAQTIYARGYSWGLAGLTAQGHTYILRRNYRNTKQIATLAAQLAVKNHYLIRSGNFVPPEATLRNGPTPCLLHSVTINQAEKQVVNKILDLIQNQLFRLSDFAILCPTNDLCRQVIKALELTELPYVFHKDSEINVLEEQVKVMTIHSAKGMEFPVVFLFGISEGILPSKLISMSQDEDEIIEQIEIERLLLYVGVTRAAEMLYIVSSQGKVSRFVSEINAFLHEEPILSIS